VRLALATLLLVGCSSGYDIEVDARPDRVSVAVYDDACGTRASAPGLGHCAVFGDEGGSSCRRHRASCVTSVRFERDGQILDEVTSEPDIDANLETMPAGIEAVIVGCGSEARVPIPAMLPTVPQITAWSGGHVEWTESGAAEWVTITLSDAGIFGTSCDLDPGLGAYDVPGSGDLLTIGAHLATTVDTPIGDAHVLASAYAGDSTLGD
jgi:hypothetical protein